MSKLKLISVLQSRIANNRNLLRYLWEEYNDYEEFCFYSKEVKTRAIIVGERQKEDKQILKQLIEDARHKQHYVEVVYDMNKELQVLRRELARYKYSVDGRPT